MTKILVLAFIFPLISVASVVTNFEIRHQNCSIGNQPVTLLRSFQMDNSVQALVVDPKTMETSILELHRLRCNHSAPDSHSRYEEILKLSTDAPYLLSNDGLTKDQTTNVYLTVDLCPSSKNFESELLQFMNKARNGIGRALPVALAVSGNWMIRHESELQQLFQLEQEKLIEITWVNHTRHHPYNSSLPADHNFLLMDGVDPRAEILEQEILMLENGMVPSVFMRFPGLISNQQTIQLVQSLGMIPVGSNAWMAKTQSFSAGDIILLHGNGNEPFGIRSFVDFVQNIWTSTSWQSLTRWGL